MFTMLRHIFGRILLFFDAPGSVRVEVVGSGLCIVLAFSGKAIGVLDPIILFI